MEKWCMLLSAPSPSSPAFWKAKYVRDGIEEKGSEEVLVWARSGASAGVVVNCVQDCICASRRAAQLSDDDADDEESCAESGALTGTGAKSCACCAFAMVCVSSCNCKSWSIVDAPVSACAEFALLQPQESGAETDTGFCAHADAKSKEAGAVAFRLPPRKCP
mmetsp:Transcript_5811/g.11178  ORF Transcript_5811/g.11178 Transcript_5811/m.11178 type:complete len:163 (+) Transcript_5811:526-1014(+)